MRLCRLCRVRKVGLGVWLAGLVAQVLVGLRFVLALLAKAFLVWPWTMRVFGDEVVGLVLLELVVWV
jgi:hypothetical protein